MSYSKPLNINISPGIVTDTIRKEMSSFYIGIAQVVESKSRSARGHRWREES